MNDIRFDMEAHVQKVMKETCMSPQELEQAFQRLQAWADANPEQAKRLEAALTCNDDWNNQTGPYARYKK